jgi:signal transduction histidine kinase
MTLRSLLLPLFALIGGFVAIVAVLLILTAESQNRMAQESSEHLARSALSVTIEGMASYARDYAYWDATVENVVLDLDHTWTADNIGAWAHDGLGMDATLVAGGDGEIFYAAIDGARVTADLDAAFSSPELNALLEDARANAHSDAGGPQAAHGFVKLGEDTMLAAAAAIVREDNGDVHARGGDASVLVYLRRVDQAFLDGLKEQFLLQDLSLQRAQAREHPLLPAALPLTAPDGTVMAYVTWNPSEPGSAFINDLALPGLAAAVVLAILLWLIVRRFRRATDALQRSHLMLSEQAYDLADQATALREARDQANAANYAKSQFLALVSHEIRTPLNAIIGFSDIIAQQAFGPKATERYQSYAKDILASGKHLLTLINDILDLSKIEAGRFELHEEEIAVDDCVQRCLALLREALDEKRLRVSYEHTGLRLFADERAFKQMLINFLSNAVKFTPDEGRIWVTCRADDTAFFLEVRDSGCGIDKKDLQRVLEPFGQAGNALRSSEGTGLGLSISKSLAELHGGSLTIEPAEVRGTRVIMSLPATRLRARPPQIAAQL